MADPPHSRLPVADRTAFAERFRAAKSISTFCHEQPDGDTLGAAVAIAIAAEQLGIPAEVVSGDGVPAAYHFLPRASGVRSEPSLSPDLAVVCDAAHLGRIGPVLNGYADWFARATVVNIDHHLTNDRFGEFNIVDDHAAATCQIVCELLPDLGVALDVDIATALLTGLVRDSQGFSTSSTSSETLLAAASMVAAGASIDTISRATMLELPVPRMALWAELLGDFQTALDDRVIYAVLKEELLASTGTTQDDADGVVEFLARGRGTRIAILFRELGSSTRVSFRTADGVNAAAIASSFSGGGHVNRSGCRIAIPADRAIPIVVEACRRYLDTAVD